MRLKVEIIRGLVEDIILNEDPCLLASKAEEMMDYQTDLAPGVEVMLRQRLARILHAE